LSFLLFFLISDKNKEEESLRNAFVGSYRSGQDFGANETSPSYPSSFLFEGEGKSEIKPR
jgi:hypothetical protein